RDFGPRLFTFFEGWGDIALPGTFQWFSGYWWIPIVGPLIGGVVGVLVYDLLVSPVLKARLTEREEGPATEEPS
ncbi:aquaporin, partial [Streptomyces violaceoruber]